MMSCIKKNAKKHVCVLVRIFLIWYYNVRPKVMTAGRQVDVRHRRESKQKSEQSMLADAFRFRVMQHI